MLAWFKQGPKDGSMNEDVFWSLIETMDVQDWDDGGTDYAPLRDGLKAFSPSDVETFYEILVQKTYALDTRSHYAAFSILPGLSDSFLYARLAVVARGRSFYEAVVAEPSQFPGWFTGAWFEFLMYVPGIAYHEMTGRDFDRASTVSIESFSNSEGWK